MILVLSFLEKWKKNPCKEQNDEFMQFLQKRIELEFEKNQNPQRTMKAILDSDKACAIYSKMTEEYYRKDWRGDGHLIHEHAFRSFVPSMFPEGDKVKESIDHLWRLIGWGAYVDNLNDSDPSSYTEMEVYSEVM